MAVLAAILDAFILVVPSTPSHTGEMEEGVIENPLAIEISQNANGSLITTNGTTNADETDLAASRQPPRGYNQIESRKVHVIWDIFAVISILTFVADIASDIVVSVLYYLDGSYLWFSLTLGFVILSSLVTQIFSVKWFYEDSEDQTWGTYLLHVFQVGPVVRYFRVIRAGWRTRQNDATNTDYEAYLAEWRDISMLRLFECFLESAPQLVLQLFIMAYNQRFEIESDLFTALAAGSSLVSLAWAIVAYTKALRDFLREGTNMSWIGFFLQIIWRLSMVASRVVALVLFASYYTTWLFVAVAIHWALMTSWLVCQNTLFCVDENGRNHLCREYLFDFVIGFVYIFSFFNIKDGMTRIRVIPYYVIMLCENTVFLVLWYPFRTLYGDVEIAALSIVWGGFGIGVLCMIAYYRFYHPSLPVKGMCVKKTQLDIQENRKVTIFLCCCCEIQTKQTITEESDEEYSFALHQRPYYDPRRNRGTIVQEQGSFPLDVDFLSRIRSIETAFHEQESANCWQTRDGIISGDGIRSMYRRSEWL
ncbi:XK-related protein 8-like [Montipora foliosa]|uniref:XK-related protein 8-like n=1 Tax=Montipora foliosa TaxID=591990 RepID=UPI0035F1918B